MQETSLADVSIVMPCLNEALGLQQSVKTAQRALDILRGHGLSGEIIIADNGSSDDSREIAKSLACKVVTCGERGYGSAITCGIKSAQGRYIVIGDADGSYNFEEAASMVMKLQEGYDVCMGSRFKGRILHGAMPWKNRYIGNPVLTAILNILYGAGISDAHCGLRAFTKSAFLRMRLLSTGMEFASEVIVKASLMKLKLTEVPVTLHPDARHGSSHLRPWRDGWRHIEFMALLSPLWLFFIPSVFLIVFGGVIWTMLLNTPSGQVFSFAGVWVGDHWMILAMGFIVVGYQMGILGIIAWVYSVKEGFRAVSPRVKRFSSCCKLKYAVIAGFVMALVGIGILASVFFSWRRQDFGALAKTREMVVATAFLTLGILTVFSSFLFAMIRRDEKQSP